MISLLAKLFIKNRNDTASPRVRSAYGMLCGLTGIALNLLLFAGKFFAGTLSGSIAITADAFNNLSDAGSSLVTLIGFRLAGKKPDPSHPFGHGRIEYISGLVVAFAILMMGFELLRSSFDKILYPAPVEWSVISVVILAASIAVKLYMTFYNRAVGKKIGSVAMKATAMDSLSDSAATATVLIATIISKLTSWQIDGWAGMLVACFILWTGYGAAKETLSPLLGQPPEKEFVREIERLVLSCDEVIGIHDLVVHDYGPGRLMISLHAEVPANGNILTLHDAIDNVEHEFSEKLGCVAVIHMDPIETDSDAVAILREQVKCFLAKFDGSLSLHDFRIVQGPTHTNLIFDVVVPYGYRLADEDIRSELCRRVAELPGNYFAVIQIDKDFSAQ